jgi:type II secretory pathway component PulC
MVASKRLHVLTLLLALLVSTLFTLPFAWPETPWRAPNAAEAAQSSRANGRQTAVLASRKTTQPHGKEVSRRGNTILVSREFADRVKKNNDIVLSKVAVKSRVDKDGRFVGYELAQIDRGSVVEKMGFSSRDVITSVNGTPARELYANRSSLEASGRFDVEILRRGRAKKLVVEIR